eukprot:COSAG02_NODE_33508_length_499_cov_0.520000_1_plen_165_part_11
MASGAERLVEGDDELAPEVDCTVTEHWAVPDRAVRASASREALLTACQSAPYFFRHHVVSRAPWLWLAGSSSDLSSVAVAVGLCALAFTGDVLRARGLKKSDGTFGAVAFAVASAASGCLEGATVECFPTSAGSLAGWLADERGSLEALPVAAFSGAATFAAALA